MDGGAIGGDGTKEQKINLDIVKALQEEAENYGMQIILTRATEDGLIAEGTEKWTKVGDLNDIQTWLGHADIQSTANIYTHISKTRKEILAKDLENTFAM